MPKNKKNRAASEALAMRALLYGCAAEIFLFVVRRYANGTANQMVLWNERYLPILAGVGVAVLAVGAILTGLQRGLQRGDRFKRTLGLSLSAAGGFVALVSLLSIWNLTVLDRLIVIVPIAAFLGIVWGLYERVCALSLTTLGVGIVATWLFSRTMQPFSTHLILSRALAVALLLALAAMMFLLRNGKLSRMLSLKSDTLLLYVSLAFAFGGILASLVNVGAATYAMWTLALVAFGLLVYYTMKQI